MTCCASDMLRSMAASIREPQAGGKRRLPTGECVFELIFWRWMERNLGKGCVVWSEEGASGGVGRPGCETCGCERECISFPRLSWIQTTEIDSLTAPEARILNWGVDTVGSYWRLYGRTLFLEALGNPWCSLDCSHITSVSAFVLTGCSPCVSVFLGLNFLLPKDTNGQMRADPPPGPHLNLIISTEFPNKVPSTGTRA